jgi:hypothetical protein
LFAACTQSVIVASALNPKYPFLEQSFFRYHFGLAHLVCARKMSRVRLSPMSSRATLVNRFFRHSLQQEWWYSTLPMFQRSELTLNGISGHLVDRGETGCYWEGTLEPAVIKQFAAGSRHKSVPVHINGEAAGYGVIQQCWFNLEAGSILVKFLYESSTWQKEPLTQPKRRSEDRVPAQLT